MRWPLAPRVIAPRTRDPAVLPQWVVIAGVGGILLVLLVLIVVTW